MTGNDQKIVLQRIDIVVTVPTGQCQVQLIAIPPPLATGIAGKAVGGVSGGALNPAVAMLSIPAALNRAARFPVTCRPCRCT